MNHPSDDPTSCCPTCAGDGTLGAAGFASWAAVLARDADVRTLDDWAAREGKLVTPHPFRISPEAYWQVHGTPPDVQGATPDEARAKAAAWVREQVKP